VFRKECRFDSDHPHQSALRIEPHALAHDGFRWHVRAFDRETKTFRNFVLGRLSDAHPGGDP
jgi:predicted DNA-binding transcriptional regulator YafY